MPRQDGDRGHMQDSNPSVVKMPEYPEGEAPKFESSATQAMSAFREMTEKGVTQAKDAYAKMKTAAEETTGDQGLRLAALVSAEPVGRAEGFGVDHLEHTRIGDAIRIIAGESIMAIRWSGEISRRHLLSNATGAAAAAALLGTTMTVQAAKLPQKAAGYRTASNGGQHCGLCAQFQPPSACKSVEGLISAQGWCSLYLPKKA